jgi:tetratricopeptide (TPR) repeat protein
MSREGPRRGAGDEGYGPEGAPLDGARLLDAARGEHRAGRAAAAEALYLEVIRTVPADAAPARHLLGVLYAQTGRAAQAVEQIAVAARLEPGNAMFLNHLGNACLAAGRPEEATAAYRDALALRPDFAEAHFNLGNALHHQGKLREAADGYRRALALEPTAVLAHVNLGVTLQQLADYPAAIAAFRSALALDPRSFDAHYNLGVALAAAGRVEEAIAAYRAALAVAPDAPWAHLNLGRLLNQEQQPGPAIAHYERAIALDPGLAVAHNNLGIALRALGRVEEAIASYRRALALQPDYVEAYSNLGNALRDRGQRAEAEAAYRKAIALRPDFVEAYFNLASCCESREESFAYFMRHAELAYGRASPAAGGAEPVSPVRAKHDLEQLDHLIEAGIVLEEAVRIRAAVGGDPSAAGLVGTLFHIEGGERLATPAINPTNDTAAIERRWTESRPNIVVIDDFLTPEALRAMQRFCWGSTMWRKEYANGYLSARPESGFATPLLLQIGEELRARFPGIFRDHALEELWAFKYDSRLSGTGIHADFAAVNVNFWITPDEANLDPAHGGLIVWDVPAPLEWDFQTYNANEGAMRDFLARSGATSMTVPYRANRAIIFDSDLFHETDRITFKEGYQNRRINVTYLYGYREK